MKKEYKDLDAERVLLSNWNRGNDLHSLVDLMQSKNSDDRLRSAYYLGELGGAIEGLKAPVTQLAGDPLAACRRAFVAYMMASGFYDKTIANALAECLQDLDLYVRVTTIKWAAQASEDVFEDFSRLVEAGIGGLKPRFPNPLSNDFWVEASLKRAIRALDIVRRLRSGNETTQIRNEISEEDSFVLDNMRFAETRRERYLAWRKNRLQH